MKRPTKDQKKQIKALGGLQDANIDLSDIPGQGNKTGWVRRLMGPVMPAIPVLTGPSVLRQAAIDVQA